MPTNNKRSTIKYSLHEVFYIVENDSTNQILKKVMVMTCSKLAEAPSTSIIITAIFQILNKILHWYKPHPAEIVNIILRNCLCPIKQTVNIKQFYVTHSSNISKGFFVYLFLKCMPSHRRMDILVGWNV